MAVYSATEFNNELDILELKLETLDPVVDHFIISESTRTHSGLQKPLYYDENKGRFEKFHHKIIHQIIDDSPITRQDLLDMKPKNDLHKKAIDATIGAYWLKDAGIAFVRDHYEKEATVMGLENANEDDVLIFGDLDEIPRPSTLSLLLSVSESHKIYALQHEVFYSFFNLQKVNEDCHNVVVLSVKEGLRRSFGKFRQFHNGIKIPNGGWHFTYMGGADNVRQKLESYSHQEFNVNPVKDNVENMIKNGLAMKRDILGRYSDFVVRDINDGTFPQYLVDNQDKFEKYIFKESL